MPIVYLGNRAAVQAEPETDPEVIAAHDGDPPRRRTAMPLGKRCTTAQIPDGVSLVEALTTITSAHGVWANHSDADSPAWVASTDPALADVLASHYGCERRDPDPDHQPSGDQAADGATTEG